MTQEIDARIEKNISGRVVGSRARFLRTSGSDRDFQAIIGVQQS